MKRMKELLLQKTKIFLFSGINFNRNHPILSLTLDNILRAISEEKYKFDHHSLTVKTGWSYIYFIQKQWWRSWLSKIDASTDKTFKCNNSTFRLYGIDYNKYFNLNTSSTTSFEIGIRESFLKITGLKSKSKSIY